MKVAALSPQFVVEPPPGEEKIAAENAANELHLKVVRPESVASTDGETLERETRAGLKRLSQLLRDSKKEGRQKSSLRDQAIAAARDAGERRKRRAMALYRDLEARRDPRQGKGENIDEYY